MADTKLGSAQIPIRATLDELDKDLSGVRKHVEGALAGVQDLGKIALGGLAGGVLAVGGAIATLGPAAISAASDLNESFSKATVVFGDSIKVIDEFAKTSASSFGIAKQTAYEATGTFGNLFTAIGLGKPEAADMSVSIVKLAADLASFNNIPVDQALEKLRSGLVGEAEPLRALGVNLTEAQVQAKALEMGLAGTAKELTPAMKVQARYALILGQTTTAQGDFARTSDGLANTQRILSATFKDISADIGTTFLPLVLGVAQAVQPLVKALMPKLQEILTALKPIITDIGNSIGIFMDQLMVTGDPIQALSDALVNFPDIKAKFDEIVAGIQTFLASIQPVIDQVMAWIGENVKLQDVLIAIGVAIAAVVLPAIWSVIATAAPIIAAFVAIVAVAALLRQAWEENWGGIRDTLTAFWEGTALPALTALWAWLSVNVPAAIQTVSNFWTNVMVPALTEVWKFISTKILPIYATLFTWQANNLTSAIKTLANFWTYTLLPALNVIWAFIQNNILPILTVLWDWLAVNVPAAIQTLTDFWNNVLMPALNAVWSFINTYIIPLLEALANVYLALVSKAVEALAGFWQNVLLPALTIVWEFVQSSLIPLLDALANVWLALVKQAVSALKHAWENLQPAIAAVSDFIEQNVIPILEGLWDFISSTLGPVLETLANVWLAGIKTAFDGIVRAIQIAIDWLKKLADAINGLKIPDPINPGSPTPFEVGLRGIAAAAALAEGNLRGMMEMSGGLTGMTAVNWGVNGESSGYSGGGTQVIVYGLTLNGVQNARGLLDELAAMG